MLNIATLKRQHEQIGELLTELKQDIARGSLEQEASSIALKISILAGKLKVHLDTEDRYMYPQLLQSGKTELKKLAQAYMDEMGYISKAFMNYKDRFNTKSKIRGNPQVFLKESQEMLEVIGQRIEKEDVSLYTVLE